MHSLSLQKAVKLGVRDYLLKPINSNELNKSLAQLAREISEDGSERTLLQSSDNHKEKNPHLIYYEHLIPGC